METLELVRNFKYTVAVCVCVLCVCVFDESSWTKEQAMEYASLHTTTNSSASIENEINKFISWPGQVSIHGINT